MRILAIDPGPLDSGFVIYEDTVLCAEHMNNEDLVEDLRERWSRDTALAIEWIENYGHAVGRDVFQTVYWTGRFAEAWLRASQANPLPLIMVPRRYVKIALCGKTTFRDPTTGSLKGIGDKHVRQAILDRFPGTGGGKTPQIGTKKQPGPLYGVKGHMWAALAVALTAEKMLLDEVDANPRVEGAGFDE